MSNQLLPSYPGLSIKLDRNPSWKFQTDELQSGKEIRSTYWFTPKIKYTLTVNCLRSGVTYQEYQRFLAFWEKHAAGFDSWLLNDPEDNAVTDHGFAVGDGATTAFQLQRRWLGTFTDQSGNVYNQVTKPYTNLLKNSSFATDTNADGLADNWTVYNGSSTTEPTVALIVPGVNGGKAQRIQWGTNNTSTKGVQQSGTPAFVAGQWSTISVYARASGTNIGQFIGLGWNAPLPSTVIAVACPPLSASYQRYVFQVFWNTGLAPLAGIFLSISRVNTGGFPPSSNTFGTLDFDHAQVTTGQWGLNDLSPIETPAASSGTFTPSYWPTLGGAYLPICDLNASPTLFQDGDWQGKRQLYPWTRTNLIGNSAALDTWTKVSAFVAANVATAPDGTATADQVTEGNPLAAPVFNSISPFSTGGTLPAGTWFVTVSALNANAEESLPSGELTTSTSGTTGSLFVGWVAVTGATGYRVYLGTATGAENTFFLPGNVTSFTITAPTGTAGTPLTSTVIPHTIVDTTAPSETVGELRCLSIFLKANTLPNLVIRGNGGNDGGIKVNLGTSAIDGSLNSGFVASGLQTSPLWNGWLRFWVVTRAPAAQGSHLIIQGCPDATYATTGYTGTGRSFFAWGAQCERVSDLTGPTPYIPTPTAAAVTVTDYSLGALGAVALTSAPAAGAVLSWTGSFYQRVRFADTDLPTSRIVNSLWSSQSFPLVTIKQL